eukprot:2114567-Prymnesium_polylepis.1
MAEHKDAPVAALQELYSLVLAQQRAWRLHQLLHAWQPVVGGVLHNENIRSHDADHAIPQSFGEPLVERPQLRVDSQRRRRELLNSVARVRPQLPRVLWAEVVIFWRQDLERNVAARAPRALRRSNLDLGRDRRRPQQPIGGTCGRCHSLAEAA